MAQRLEVLPSHFCLCLLLKSESGPRLSMWAVIKAMRKSWLAPQLLVNSLRPNSDLSQTSHRNIKGLLVSEVMRIENMITQVKFH